MISFGWRISRTRLLLVVLLLSIIPFPTPMIPEWHLTVVDREGNLLTDVQVEQNWKHYTYFFVEGSERERSNETGEVVFPARWLWASALSRVLSPMLAEAGKVFHGSTELSIDARVWDPERRYFSSSSDQIFWDNKRQSIDTLPNHIVGTKETNGSQ